MKVVPPTRRDVLRLAGVGVGAAALGCGDNEASRPPGARDAVAVLEPESDSFIVAAWSATARAVTVEVRDRAGDLVASPTVAIDGAGQAAVPVTGLLAATGYEVTVLTDTAVRLGPHHVRTAPLPDDPRPVRIGVSADLDPSREFDSDLLVHLAAAAPDQYVSIGDCPYTDNGPPAMTVATYRERHAELRTKPAVRAWLESVGVRAIYDDHEFRNDWDGNSAALEPERYAAAMQVWDEFFPLRAAQGEIRYRSWRYGAHVECFLLDCRRFRSANSAPDDEHKTMLGEVQRAWLLDGVTTSVATFKLVFTTVPLDFGTGTDHWASFTTERAAILDALVGTPGVLFVSGDQHFFAAHQHAHGVREFQIGPLARGLGVPGAAPPGVLFRAVQYNFGLIDVDGDALRFSGVGASGEVFYAESFTAAQLTPV